MDAQLLKDVQAAIEQGVKSSFVYATLILAVGALVGAYLGAYLSERAKNLALKQDLKALTIAVESIKTELQTQMAYKLVALERRLEAHQKASELAARLAEAADSEQPMLQVRAEIFEWLRSNSMYLEKEAVEALQAAYDASHIHPMLLRRKGKYEPFDIRTAEENLAILRTAPGKISSAFGRPPPNTSQVSATSESGA